jgi:tRNA1(Val) A37 N6-methylase TrmN6
MSLNKRKRHLRLLILEYVQSVLEMATSVDPKNINQVISLMKANIRVLENDVKNSFAKRENDDFAYREFN